MLNNSELDDGPRPSYMLQLSSTVYKFQPYMYKTCSMFIALGYLLAKSLSGYDFVNHRTLEIVDIGFSSIGFIILLSALYCLSYPVLFIYTSSELSNYTIDAMNLFYQHRNMYFCGILLDFVGTICLIVNLFIKIYIIDWILSVFMIVPIIIFICVSLWIIKKEYVIRHHSQPFYDMYA